MNIPLLPENWANRFIACDWSTIRYAINKGLLTTRTAIQIAALKISDSSPDEEITLAGLSKSEIENAQMLIDTLANTSQNNGVQENKHEILKIYLCWLYENSSKFENPFEIIDQLYAQMDYPNEIEHLVSYTPAEGETGMPYLKKQWEQFIS